MKTEEISTFAWFLIKNILDIKCFINFTADDDADFYMDAGHYGALDDYTSM